MLAKREFLADVIIIETGDKKDTLIFAKRAVQVPSDDESIQLDLQEGRRFEIAKDSQLYNKVGFGSYRIRLDLKTPSTHNAKFEGQTTKGLLARNDPKAYAELAYRFSLPWAIWLAILMALPLSKVSPRQGRWLKLVPSILLYVVAVLAIISLKDPIAKGKVGVWAYPVLIVLMLGLAGYANYHSQLVNKKRLQRGAL